MVLDPTPSATHQGLPVYFYQSEIKVVGGEPKMGMRGVGYKIVTEESERVAVDHVAHLTSQSVSESNCKFFFLLLLLLFLLLLR